MQKGLENKKNTDAHTHTEAQTRTPVHAIYIGVYAYTYPCILRACRYYTGANGENCVYSAAYQDCWPILGWLSLLSLLRLNCLRIKAKDTLRGSPTARLDVVEALLGSGGFSDGLWFLWKVELEVLRSRDAGPKKTNLAILMVAVGDSVFFVCFHRRLPCGFYVQVQTSPG